MDVTRVVELVEEATQSVPGRIGTETVLAGEDVWDSMSMVMFLGLVFEETGIELTLDELVDAATPAGITGALGTRRRR